MPEPMSNELIVHTLQDIQLDVKEIKTQTQKTNGRVTDLEKWRAYIAGAIAVVTIMLVPIFIKIVLDAYFLK